MTLTVNDLNPKKTDSSGLNFDDLKSGQGLDLSELTKTVIDVCSGHAKFLGKDDWIDWENSIYVDTETSVHNSRFEVIQAYDYAESEAYLFVRGQAEDKTTIISNFKDFNVKVVEVSKEKDLVKEVAEYLKQKGKPIIGHNFSHFDMGHFAKKKTQYGINGLRFQHASIGAPENREKRFFSYTIDDDNDKDFSQRRLIVDLMHICFTLGLPGSLKDLSRMFSPYPKKEIDFEEFAKDVKSNEALIYAIYDVLSLPYVYKEIKKLIYDISVNYLKAPKRASVLCYEHLWQKSAAQVAECWLNQSIGRKSLYLPDFANKYFGGLTSGWKPGITQPSGSQEIREVDLTSAYPMAIIKQGILDILNGDFEDCSGYKNVDEVYDDLIDASTILVRSKNPMQIVKIEAERQKDNSPTKNQSWTPGIPFSPGFIKSHDKTQNVADTQRDFGYVKFVKRGEKIVLTKTEIELNKIDDPDFLKKFDLVKVQNGFRATSHEKSQEIANIYNYRQQLKKEGNLAEHGFKIMLNTIYGKLANEYSDYYCSCLAASITGFTRREIYELKRYADKKGMESLYTDTDSLYAKGTEEQFEQLINYSNKINDVPQKMFGRNALDDEGENIHIFKVTKRKRYTKVYDKDGERRVIVKGGSYSDLNWRHYLYELSTITGECSVEGINRAISELDFSKGGEIDTFEFEQFLKNLYDEFNGQDLRELIPALDHSESKKLPITLGKKIHLKNQVNYPPGTFMHYAIQSWVETVWAHNLAEKGYDYNELVERKQQLEDLKKDQKKLEKIPSSKWQFFYDLLKDEKEAEGYGERFSEEESIRDGYAYHFKKLGGYFRIDINLHSSNFYLKLFEKLREYDLLELINKFAPVKQQVLDIGETQDQLNNINNQINTLEYEIEELEEKFKKVPKPEPYPGLFFEVYPGNGSKHGIRYNLDDSQVESYIDDDTFSLNYELYETPPDHTFKISAEYYNQILFQPLEIDTLTFIQKDALPLHNFNDKDKKKITGSLYSSNHSGIDNINAPRKILPQYGAHKALLWKMRLERDDNGELTLTLLRDIMEDKEVKETYYNTALYVNAIGRVRGAVRINKWRMIDPNPTIFSMVYEGSKVQNFVNRWLEDRLEQNGVKINLPLFSMVYQLDVSQETTEEFYDDLFNSSLDVIKNRVYPVNIRNSFILHEFKTYINLNAYNKERSAYEKILKKNMAQFEKEYFEWEAQEGYRVEVKFMLQRPLAQVIPYAYVLNAINKEEFIKYAKDAKQIHSKKETYRHLGTRWGMSAVYGFSEERCYVLFIPEKVIKTQVSEHAGLPMTLDHLEGHGSIVDTTPPNAFNKITLIKGLKVDSAKWWIKNQANEVLNSEEHHKKYNKELYKEEIIKNGALPIMNGI